MFDAISKSDNIPKKIFFRMIDALKFILVGGAFQMMCFVGYRIRITIRKRMNFHAFLN